MGKGPTSLERKEEAMLCVEYVARPYMGHNSKSMHKEFKRHLKNAREFLKASFWELYRVEIALAAAFLEAEMTFPF